MTHEHGPAFAALTSALRDRAAQQRREDARETGDAVMRKALTLLGERRISAHEICVLHATRMRLDDAQ